MPPSSSQPQSSPGTARPKIKIILRTKPSTTMAQEGNTPTTVAAAEAFDSVMEEHELQNGTAARAADGDVVMSDAAPNRNASPAILPGATLQTYRSQSQSHIPPASLPQQGNSTPQRTNIQPPSLSTQTSQVQQQEQTSRATSQHPETQPERERSDGKASFPKVAAVHGAPTRQYLNGKVTTVLLEGMKVLARDQPKDPLKVLGEYLLQRSKEIEGS